MVNRDASQTSMLNKSTSLVTSILLCGFETWTLLADSEKKKGGIQAFETKCLTTVLRISYLEYEANDWLQIKTNLIACRSTETPSGNLHGSGTSHAMTASPNPSFRAPWRLDDAVVGRGNAGWTTSKSGHPCQCQNSSR